MKVNTDSDLKAAPKKILIIDDEENMRHMLAVMLNKYGYSVETAADGSEGLDVLEKEPFDFILCDIKMPNMDGLAFLKAARGKLDNATVIMMSAYGSIDTALEAMKLGAYDYIAKPFKSDEVALTLKKAEERENLKSENRLLKERIRIIGESSRFGNMIGKSKAMQAVFRLAEKVAVYDSTVLITGESGTGKELIARGIHFQGGRSKGPLVPVNCGGIPENLLESELFGHKKGAFTGADRDKKGLFEEAQAGTIFLDEIGELPLALQVKLLRVFQESEIRSVGDSRTKNIDVRVIAATSKVLEDEVKRGRFREDLFYRLNVLPIHIPPLRQRNEDIPPLCRHFLEQFNQNLDKDIKQIDSSAMALLMQYDWPGNVRELENIIERAAILTDTDILMPDVLPPEFAQPSATAPADNMLESFSLKKTRKVVERNLIVKALKETGGNRTRAAKLLEISHPSLLSKMKTYRIDL